MKVVIFHADIEYLVRMGEKKLKQIQWAKKQKKKKEKKPHKWICLVANKIPFSSFHLLFVLIVLLLLFQKSFLLCMSTG